MVIYVEPYEPLYGSFKPQAAIHNEYNMHVLQNFMSVYKFHTSGLNALKRFFLSIELPEISSLMLVISTSHNDQTLLNHSQQVTCFTEAVLCISPQIHLTDNYTWCKLQLINAIKVQDINS